MIRLAVMLSFILCLHSICLSQESPDVQNKSNNSSTADTLVDADSRPEQKETIADTNVSDFVALTFVLLMFTNAIFVGRWALETDRNFWAWYIFGLFTGPLAGGFMLHRVAGDKAGGKNPSGCLAALLGIGIPAAGWFIWIAILK